MEIVQTGFRFSKFIADSVNIVISPKTYFTNMEKTGGWADPIIKALIYGLAAGIIALILILLKLIPGSNALISFSVAPISALVSLVLGSVITLLFSLICGGSRNFETIVRVQASLLVLYPVNILSNAVSYFNMTAGFAVGLVISLFGLYLFYHGLTYGLNGQAVRAKVLTGILGTIILFLSFMAMIALKNFPTMSKDMIQNMEKSGRINAKTAQEMEDQMQKMLKDFDPNMVKKTEEEPLDRLPTE